jgi:hypothetical protein
LPAYVTVPVTGEIPRSTRKLAGVTVAGLSGSLKVAIITAFTETLVAASAGTVVVTVGGVMSGAAPVVNDHTYPSSNALPARSSAPVVIVAVKVVLGNKSASGLNVAPRFEEY